MQRLFPNVVMSKCEMRKNKDQQDTQHGMMSFLQVVRNDMTCCSQANGMVPGHARRNLDAESPINQVRVDLRTIPFRQIVQQL